MANIREAFEYASKNPNSEFARNLKTLAASGALNNEAKQNGIDLSPFQQKVEQPRSIGEKVLDVTGGKEIAQGLGQAIAAPANTKRMDAALKDATDVQFNLVKLIKEKKALGQDTSALERTLTQQDVNINQIAGQTEQILNPNQLTNKQVIGDALQLATTAGGAKVAGAVAGKATQATGIGAGLLQGAKTGAIAGSVLGGATGVSQGLQEDLDARGIAKKAVGGAVTGALTGGVLGAVTGGVAGGIKSSRVKKQGFIEDLVSPKATQDVKERALQEGRVTDPGLFKKSTILPSKKDKQLADAVKDVVSDKKSVTQNLNSIKTKVGEINTGVKAYVKDNKVPFNTKQLTKQLNNGKDELKLVFASDKQAEKTYDAVVKEFMKHVAKKDTAGLLDARQEFDKIPAIKKLLDSQGLGENTKKEVVLTARRMANEYIAKLLPTGNQYRNQLLQESRMIEAIGNIAEKNTTMIGKNKLQQLVNEYPVLKWAVSGAVGAAGIGVGSTIIGSTD